MNLRFYEMFIFVIRTAYINHITYIRRTSYMSHINRSYMGYKIRISYIIHMSHILIKITCNHLKLSGLL